MIEMVCAHIHNYFKRRVFQGSYTIENGALALDALKPGQYFRIIGSAFNDGVFLYPADGLTDETFTGEIWEMCPPRLFLDLVSRIEAWEAKYGDSPYASEDVIGVYSYTRSDGGKGWAGAFAGELNPFRKLS